MTGSEPGSGETHRDDVHSASVAPLDGIRVVDLCGTAASAQATQLFGDFGAEVIQIERPGGSGLRRLSVYPFWACGKKSLVLDFTDPNDIAVARSLVDQSDVLVESFRPGIAERLGLGYEAIRVTNPRLVYTSITGFGRSGPDAQIKGYEGIVMAKLGGFQAFHKLSLRDGPSFTGMPWCSYAASHTAVHGTLAALYERETSGVGQHVDVNLAQSFLALDSVSWFLHLVGERYPDAYRPAEAFEDGKPNSVFAFFVLSALTGDGQWIQFSQARPHLFRAFMRVLELEWMFDDPHWAGIPMFDDSERRLDLWVKMLEAVNKRTYVEWQAVFADNTDVWAEAYRHPGEALTHPQLEHDSFAVTIDDPDRGPIVQPGPLVRFESSPSTVGIPAPTLDQHGSELRSRASAGVVDRPVIGTRPSPASLPLDGVTVLELAYLMAAPLGATLLTDLGARVIKVEPLDGDPIRSMLPFPEAGGIKFMQGKHSICVDLTTDEGREIVHRIAREADLVLQSFRPGVAERLGVDAKSLMAVNPDLVYLDAPGYGIEGPCALRPAFAPCIAAASGIGRLLVGDTVPEGMIGIDDIKRGSMVLAGASGNMNAQSDGVAALGVATAALLGLIARRRGAPGQRALTTMLATATQASAVNGIGVPGRLAVDDELLGYSALYRLYRSSEGWVFLAALASHEWADLAQALRRWGELGDDPRFLTEQGRRDNDAALAGALAAVFEQRTAAEWERDLVAVDVACVAVTTGSVESVVWSDDVGRAAGYVADVVHPMLDEHVRLAPIIRFSRSATQALPGCLAGQHTHEVLVELGYSQQQIADLRRTCVIG